MEPARISFAPACSRGTRPSAHTQNCMLLFGCLCPTANEHDFLGEGEFGMDKKIAGLVGAISSIAAMTAVQAAPSPNVTEVSTARSYAELLQPIPNASRPAEGRQGGGGRAGKNGDRAGRKREAGVASPPSSSPVSPSPPSSSPVSPPPPPSSSLVIFN